MAGLLPYRRLIEAGRTTKIGARGNKVIVRNAVGEIAITTRQSKVSSKDAQAYTLTLRKFEKWESAEEFDEIEVRNPDASAKEVELLIGYGDFVRELTSRTDAAKELRSGVINGANTTSAVFAIVGEKLLRKRILLSLVNQDGDFYLAEDQGLVYAGPLGAEQGGVDPDLIGFSDGSVFADVIGSANFSFQPFQLAAALHDDGPDEFVFAIVGNFPQNTFHRVALSGTLLGDVEFLTAEADDFQTGGGSTVWRWNSVPLFQSAASYPIAIYTTATAAPGVRLGSQQIPVEAVGPLWLKVFNALDPWQLSWLEEIYDA